MISPNENYCIPFTAERKLARLFRQSSTLSQDKELQQQIVDWAKEMLAESRSEWEDMHAASIGAVISSNRRTEAIKRGKFRDKKYAPFREYFAKLQQRKFIEYKETGQKLSANGFAVWFMENKPQNIEIPYKESNRLHKLIQLAEENNRKLKNHL